MMLSQRILLTLCLNAILGLTLDILFLNSMISHLVFLPFWLFVGFLRHLDFMVHWQ